MLETRFSPSSQMGSPSPEIHVTKTGIPIRNLWHMLLYAWDAVTLRDNWRSDVESAPSLDALLAAILMNLVQQRLRIGLGRDYRNHEAEVAGVRGRVDFGMSVKRMSFQHGRAYCRFQVFSADVQKNQIIRSTMARLVQVGDFGHKRSDAETVRHRLRRLVLDMDSVSITELKASNIRREQLRRHDRDYSVMLAICSLLNRGQMPTEQGGQSNLPGLDRDAMLLYDVYEKFVAKFFAYRLKEWRVSSQPKLVWPAEDTCDYLPVMKPDVILQHNVTRRLLVLDTKFTAKSLVTGQWGKQVFSRDHIFQLYAYLRSQEHQSENHKTSTGILLYPTVGERLSEQVRIQGHLLRWDSIDLSQPWEIIEEDLLRIPADAL